MELSYIGTRTIIRLSWSYQNKSCHSVRETGSWCNSFRTVGRIKGHLSSNCNWPCC